MGKETNCYISIMSPEEEAYEKWLEENEKMYADPYDDFSGTSESFRLLPEEWEEYQQYMQKLLGLGGVGLIHFWCKQSGVAYSCFTSHSKGRGRKLRKEPKVVEIIVYGGKGGQAKRVPLDEIAQELLPQPIYDLLGSNPGEEFLMALRGEK